MTTQPVTWDSCTCRVRLLSQSTAEQITVKSGRWDCPSCGLDKANRIRDMVVTANASRMWVGTFKQPKDDPDGPHPAGYELCDPDSHVYLYKDGTWRWRRLESCAHCCRATSRSIKVFRERLRRRYPDAQILWVREVKPLSGAFDINFVVVGVPDASRRNRVGRRIKQDWYELNDGAHFDLGDGFKGKRSPGAAGRYIGKYLTKLADRPMAKGFRRWGRSRGFAPDIRMIDPREPRVDPETGEILTDNYSVIGWVDIDGVTVLDRGLRRRVDDGGSRPLAAWRAACRAPT